MTFYVQPENIQEQRFRLWCQFYFLMERRPSCYCRRMKVLLLKWKATLGAGSWLGPVSFRTPAEAAAGIHSRADMR